MSHPQFYCKIFTLRHAWLNLRDKHMTTGRINQVIAIQLSWLKPHNNMTHVGVSCLASMCKVWMLFKQECCQSKCAHIIKPNLQCWHNVLEHSTEHRQHAQLQSLTLQPQANAANAPPFLIVCKDWKCHRSPANCELRTAACTCCNAVNFQKQN